MPGSWRLYAVDVRSPPADTCKYAGSTVLRLWTDVTSFETLTVSRFSLRVDCHVACALGQRRPLLTTFTAIHRWADIDAATNPRLHGMWIRLVASKGSPAALEEGDGESLLWVEKG